jgi:hypothetical protein
VKIEGFIEADTGSPIPTVTNYQLLDIERLTLPRGALRVFAAVREITTLPVFHPGQDLALGSAVGSKCENL